MSKKYPPKHTPIQSPDQSALAMRDAAIWGAALQRIQQQGIDANINTEIPDFVAGIFKKAIDAGYGQENVMALVKVLQGDQ